MFFSEILGKAQGPWAHLVDAFLGEAHLGATAVDVSLQTIVKELSLSIGFFLPLAYHLSNGYKPNSTLPLLSTADLRHGHVAHTILQVVLFRLAGDGLRQDQQLSSSSPILVCPGECPESRTKARTNYPVKSSGGDCMSHRNAR